MIGRLRERIEIQTNTQTVDSSGFPSPSWATTVTLWARAQFLIGRELEAMNKINSEVTMTFTVRYRTDITVKQRISWRSEFWNIHAILPDEEKRYMQLASSKVE